MCANADNWWGKDKVEHYAGSGLISTVAYVGAQRAGYSKKESFVIAILTTAVVGAGKEWYDHRHPSNHTVSTKDFTAGMLGGIIGPLAYQGVRVTFEF